MDGNDENRNNRERAKYKPKLKKEVSGFNIFSKELNNRRYSSLHSFGEHKVGIVNIKSDKIGKSITIFMELYPEYIEDILVSISANYNRILIEFGIEKVGFFTKIKIKSIFKVWRQKIIFNTYKNGKITQKSLMIMYKGIFEDICRALKYNVKLQLTEVKTTTLRKVLRLGLTDLVGSQEGNKYTRNNMKTPLWWCGYIKECLNRLGLLYERSSVLGLFNIIFSGYQRDIQNEIILKPNNWGCFYRLSNKDEKWVKHQYIQLVDLTTNVGLCGWFLFQLFQELYNLQEDVYSEKYNKVIINDAIKISLFRNQEVIGDLYRIFKSCRGNRKKFCGCMGVITDLSLVVLDEATTNEERLYQWESYNNLLSEFKYYLDDFRNVDNCVKSLLNISITKDFIKDIKKINKDLPIKDVDLPESIPRFITKFNLLSLEIHSLLQIFTNNSWRNIKFLWDFWDNHITNPEKDLNDVKDYINTELFNEYDLVFGNNRYNKYSRQNKQNKEMKKDLKDDFLYDVIRTADVNYNKWVEILKDDFNIKDNELKNQLYKLAYFLSISS